MIALPPPFPFIRHYVNYLNGINVRRILFVAMYGTKKRLGTSEIKSSLNTYQHIKIKKMKTINSKTQIGITEMDISKEAAVLCGFLADEFLLSLKTKNAHWNLEGADFYAKHHFFEEQYNQLDELIDELAEYIRSLGHYAPATMKEFLQLTHLTEQRDQNNKSIDFVKDLLADHESMIIHLRENVNRFDDQLHDAGTSDFITDLMRRHTKMAWMLRAQLN